MLEFAEMLKVRRKTRWSWKERSFLAISGIPTIMHVQVGAPDQNSFRCATCESFGAVATCIPTFVACDGRLSRKIKSHDLRPGDVHSHWHHSHDCFLRKAIRALWRVTIDNSKERRIAQMLWSTFFQPRLTFKSPGSDMG